MTEEERLKKRVAELERQLDALKSAGSALTTGVVLHFAADCCGEKFVADAHITEWSLAHAHDAGGLIDTVAVATARSIAAGVTKHMKGVQA